VGFVLHVKFKIYQVFSGVHVKFRFYKVFSGVHVKFRFYQVFSGFMYMNPTKNLIDLKLYMQHEPH
jgi:hypothetical protein